jgi:hypothetical protein
LSATEHPGPREVAEHPGPREVGSHRGVIGRAPRSCPRSPTQVGFRRARKEKASARVRASDTHACRCARTTPGPGRPRTTPGPGRPEQPPVRADRHLRKARTKGSWTTLRERGPRPGPNASWNEVEGPDCREEAASPVARAAR